MPMYRLVCTGFTYRNTSRLIGLFWLLAAVAGYGQGTVNFVNWNANTIPVIDARIGYTAGGPMPETWVDSAVSAMDIVTGIWYGGGSAQVGLYGGPAGSRERDLVLLVPSVGFGTGVNAGYIWSGADTTRSLAGLAPGEGAVFQLRGWDAGLAAGETTPAQSYEEADLLSAIRGVYLGKSKLVTVSALGGGELPPAELIGLTRFDLPWVNVPEPAVLALAVVGILAWLMGLKRSH